MTPTYPPASPSSRHSDSFSSGGRFNTPLDAFDYQRLSTSDRFLEDQPQSPSRPNKLDASLAKLRLPSFRNFLLGFSILIILHWLGLLFSSTYSNYASLESIALKSGLGSDGSPLSWLGKTPFSSTAVKTDEGVPIADETWLRQMGVDLQDPTKNAINSTRKAKAAFVILARNTDVWEILGSIRQIEDRFNRKYHYPYVFLNNEAFTSEFKKHTSAIASGTCTYGLIPPEQWSKEPDWIDQDKAAKGRADLVEKKVVYGGSVSYRRMCRYQSGFFWRHPLLDEYDYYWRIEPGVKFFCDIDYDPFVYMRDNNKKYGFTITIHEYRETIPTLWEATTDFIHANQHYVEPDNLINWISDDQGRNYNLCHFWSNFEIGDLNFFRSPAYRDYFNHLDKRGGFFYERWGDAPVHSIAASLFLKKDQVHWFRDIGYRHDPFQHCPALPKDKDRCSCNPTDSFETHWYSCTAKYKEIQNMKE